MEFRSVGSFREIVELEVKRIDNCFESIVSVIVRHDAVGSEANTNQKVTFFGVKTEGLPVERRLKLHIESNRFIFREINKVISMNFVSPKSSPKLQKNGIWIQFGKMTANSQRLRSTFRSIGKSFDHQTDERYVPMDGARRIIHRRQNVRIAIS